MTATITIPRAQLELAIEIFWTQAVYTMKPDHAGVLLDRAAEAYHCMMFVFPEGSDERALLRWLAESCGSLAHYKLLESLGDDRARATFQAAASFATPEQPGQFTLTQQQEGPA